MEIKRLEVLVLLSKYNKLVDVAKIMGISQPTVSFHLKKLEEEIGVALIHKHHKRIFLTEAGKTLVHYAEKIISFKDEALRVMDEYKNAEHGSLVIGASHVPAVYVLPNLISQFIEEFPNIHLSLRVKTAPVILNMLKNHELDLGLVLAEHVDEEELRAEVLFSDQLVLIFPPDHPLADREEIQLEDLQKELIILHEASSTTRKLFDHWVMSNQLSFPKQLELGSVEAIKEAVVAKLGISVLSLTAVEREVATQQLSYRSLPGLTIPFYHYLVYHQERVLTPVLKECLAFMRAFKKGKS